MRSGELSLINVKNASLVPAYCAGSSGAFISCTGSFPSNEPRQSNVPGEISCVLSYLLGRPHVPAVIKVKDVNLLAVLFNLRTPVISIKQPLSAFNYARWKWPTLMLEAGGIGQTV